MISAEQIAATLANLGVLRDAGLYADALAYHELGEIGVRAYWTHESTDSTRMTAVLPANGVPKPLPGLDRPAARRLEATRARGSSSGTPRYRRPRATR